MHKSLEPGANVVAAVASLAVCSGVAVFFPEPRVWWSITLGGVVGLACGLLQDRAIRGDPEAFLRAEDALAVRRSLLASGRGRAAIVLQWILGAGLIAVALSGPSTGRFAVLSGYFAMMCLREVCSIPALLWLPSQAISGTAP